MTGFDLSMQEFAYLVGVASRHHVEMIAGWVSLTVRRGETTIFLDHAGSEVTLGETHGLCQADPQVKRWVYNLFMSYAR